MSHPLILFIIPIALGTIILVSGFIAYKAPMSFEQKDTVWKYPMYSGEKALESKETWSKAQKIYGKSLSIQCHLDKVFYDENSISYAVMH